MQMYLLSLIRSRKSSRSTEVRILPSALSLWESPYGRKLFGEPPALRAATPPWIRFTSYHGGKNLD